MLSELIEEAGESRNTIAELPVMFDSGDESFAFDRWDVHRSSRRYGRLLLGVVFGSTTRRIFPIVAAVVAFSAGVDYYNNVAMLGGSMEGSSFFFRSEVDFGLPPEAYGFLPELQLPITPFELTAPVLGLLLVFRTDTAYDRFNFGAEQAWEVTAATRSLMRRLIAWTGTAACTDEERAAAADLVTACFMMHGWVMGTYLKGEPLAEEKQLGEDFQAALLQTALGEQQQGQETEIGAKLAALGRAQRQTPSLSLTAISLGAAQRLPTLSDQERIGLDDELATVTSALAKCEKVLRTPIPLGYTRYSVRFLWIWLSLLPFALVRTFNDFGVNTWWADKPQPVLLLAMGFISFIFLSIEDIAVQIEEPFAILPLELHHKYLSKDVEQMRALMDWANERRRSQEDEDQKR